MLIDEWSHVLTHKSMYGRRGGGKISVHRFGGGGKNVARDYRGGARFECERFSEFHRRPAVNNDHSLIL